MRTFLTIFLVIAMLAALGIVIFGFLYMARGGNPRVSNRLMQARVVMQGLALALLAILMMMAAGGHR